MLKSWNWLYENQICLTDFKKKVEFFRRQDARPAFDFSSPVTRHLSLESVCHAGAIVLLVGFWFDGGLFNLPTAATFWILLELGSVKIRHQQ